MLAVSPQQKTHSGTVGVDQIHLYRLTRYSSYLLVSMTLAACLFWSWGGAISILIGGAIAFLNFQWITRAVDQILGVGLETGEPIDVGRFVAGYLGRLLLILVGLFAMIYLSFLSLLGGLMGFSIFVLAGFLEAIHLLLRRRGTG